MLTVILGGGKSSRMGRDKVTLDFGGSPLVKLLVERYSALPWPLALSVDRAGRFETYGAVELTDVYAGQGPMAGLHAAFAKTDTDGVFLVAADMPFGSPELALKLAELAKGHDACCIETGRGLEPLFAVYHRSCMPAVEACLSSGRRSAYAVLEQVDTRVVRPEELEGFELEHILKNMNRPEDYAAAVREADEYMYRAKIDKFFEENKQAMFDDVARLVRIKSVREAPLEGKPFGEGPARALEAALDCAAGMGFKVRNFENYAGTVELNEHEPVMGILAHLDVVDEGEDWHYPPYEPTVVDGLMYGRGTSDDKGPAVVSLYAMAAARSIEPELTRGMRLVLGCAEETGSECMAYYFKQEPAPANVFSPDACYPVINVEKGHFRPKFGMEWREGRALPRIVSVSGGSTANIVPGRASAVIEGIDASELTAAMAAAEAETGIKFSFEADGALFTVKAEGVTSHASRPEGGNNAQTGIIKLLASLPLAEDGATGAVRILNELFPHGDYNGRALGIDQRDEISGELTLNFSVLELDARGFTAQFDSRVPICANKENTARPVIERLEGCGIRLISGRSMIPPHHTPAESEFVQTLLKAYEDYTGKPGECLAMGGGTYVHDVEGGVAFGCGMPGREYNIHGADEFMDLEEMLLSAKIFTEVILRMCK